MFRWVLCVYSLVACVAASPNIAVADSSGSFVVSGVAHCLESKADLDVAEDSATGHGWKLLDGLDDERISENIRKMIKARVAIRSLSGSVDHTKDQHALGPEGGIISLNLYQTKSGETEWECAVFAGRTDASRIVSKLETMIDAKPASEMSVGGTRMLEWKRGTLVVIASIDTDNGPLLGAQMGLHTGTIVEVRGNQ